MGMFDFLDGTSSDFNATAPVTDSGTMPVASTGLTAQNFLDSFTSLGQTALSAALDKPGTTNIVPTGAYKVAPNGTLTPTTAPGTNGLLIVGGIVVALAVVYMFVRK